jgi:hypothetical protein
MRMSTFDLDSMDDNFLAFCWYNLSPRDRAKVMAQSRRTVWLFGAGASHHYNLNSRGVPVPLANDFFEAFNALPTSHGFHAHVGPFISYLGHHRGVPPEEVSRWRENIETFMTSIDEEIMQLGARRADRTLNEGDLSKALSLAMVFNNMSFILASVVNEAQNGPSDSLYRHLLDFCGPNDAFVTFNWDTLSDRALVDTGGWTPNDGYGLHFASVLDGTWKSRVEGAPKFPTDWTLLKLHGSTNWLVPYTHVDLRDYHFGSSFPKSHSIFLYWQASLPYATHKTRWRGGYAPTCYCYYPPNLPSSCFSQEQISAPPGRVWVRATLKGIFAPFDEPDADGVPSSPLLITPVRQKKYDVYRATMESLWGRCASCLETANRIVIVGYSFPSTDTRSLDLLRAALYARRGEIDVEIVAPDADAVASRIGEESLSNAKRFTRHRMKFEDYFQVLTEDAPRLMKEAALEYGEVRKWVETNYAMQQAAFPPHENGLEAE